jgi:RNA polymerase sigma-70 factor (ECF subfamily)
MDQEREKKLIESAKTDKVAFSILYHHYFPQIFNYTLRRLGNLAAAQEVTSDTFFEAMTDIKKYEWRGVPFSAWLYRIATNNSNSYLRKKSNRLLSLDFLFEKHSFEIADTSDIEEELQKAEEELQRHKDFIELHKCILQLPLKYQEVIVLRFFEKKKINEISKILNRNENTVKSLLKRGLEKMQLFLKKSA